jgi:hypothetical protein
MKKIVFLAFLSVCGACSLWNGVAPQIEQIAENAIVDEIDKDFGVQIELPANQKKYSIENM